MKLRLHVSVPLQDLSYRFRVGITVESNIFHRWLDVMSRELKQLIVCWLDISQHTVCNDPEIRFLMFRKRLRGLGLPGD